MNHPLEPCILMETSQGYTSCRLQDNLLKYRSVLCFGEITAELADSLMLQMLYLGKQSKEPITMYIHSPGGGVNSGFAIYDTMRMVGCPIHTVCMGEASSMAAVLFATGDHRGILEHGQVLIHDPLVQQLSGSTLKVKDWSDHMLRSRDEIAHILSARTGRSVEQILEKTRREAVFYAREAVEFGLADEILRSADGLRLSDSA